MESCEAWVASWMTDEAARWTFVDPAWLAYTGQDAGAAGGSGWFAAVDPEDREAAEAQFRAAHDARAAFSLTVRLRRADGARRAAFVSGHPRFGPDGAFLGHVGAVTDPGGGQARDDGEGEAGDRYRTLLEALSDGVFIAQDRRFVFANPALATMLGHAHSAFVGLPFAAVVAPEDLRLWTTRYEARVGDGPEPPRHYALRLLRADGRRLEAELSARRIRHKGRNAVLGVVRDVSERRAAEAALRDSEERFRQVVQSLPQLVWTCAPDGPCDYLSPQWLAFTGVPEAPQLGYGWLEQLHPDDRARTIEEWRVTSARGENFVVDFRVRRHDGVYRWFHTLAVPLRDGGGRILKWFGSNTDITEIKEVSDALRESERRFASFMRHLPGLAWIKDTAGRYVYVNAAAAAAFDKGADDVLGRTDEDIFDPATAAAFRQNDARAIASEAGFVTVETLRQNDGVLHQSLVSKFPIRDAAGAIRGTGGVALDITERQHIEETLEQQSRLIELSFEPIFMWDWERGIVSWNRGCEQLYGFLRAETVGRASRELLQTRFPVSRADYEKTLLSSGAWAGELTHVAKDGQEICVESRHRLIETGGRKLVLEANRDITERKRAEDALRDANRRKDEFLATLAHELRNPLSPIDYGVQLLKKAAGEAATPPDPALLAMMERQVVQLVKLVDDLLEISRIDRGKIELRKEQADIAAIVRSALETSRLQVEKGGHRLVTRLSDESLLVCGDPLRLAQALTNLINNAAKFTPPGGLIEVETGRRDADAVIRVRDNGQGIPADALPHVFDLFTQIGPRDDRRGGLGIGLALVRKLVALHGGKVEAFSAGPGKGSEFVVTLPLDLRPPAPAPAPESAAPRPRLVARVAIVDDDRDAADSLRLLLERLGARVRVAYDGARGADLVEAFAPDVVFLDLGMPGVDGFDAARRIRRGAAGKQAFLVALTGWGQARDRAKTKDAGFDAHLTKPASIEALEAILRRPATAGPIRRGDEIDRQNGIEVVGRDET